MIEDVTLPMTEKQSETWLYFEVTAEPQIDGSSAELTYRTS